MDKFKVNDYVKVMTTKSSSDCSAQTENMILAVGYVESIVSNSNPQDEKIIVKCTNEQKQEVYEAVSNAVQSLGYDDVEVA